MTSQQRSHPLAFQSSKPVQSECLASQRRKSKDQFALYRLWQVNAITVYALHLLLNAMQIWTRHLVRFKIIDKSSLLPSLVLFIPWYMFVLTSRSFCSCCTVPQCAAFWYWTKHKISCSSLSSKVGCLLCFSIALTIGIGNTGLVFALFFEWPLLCESTETLQCLVLEWLPCQRPAVIRLFFHSSLLWYADEILCKRYVRTFCVFLLLERDFVTQIIVTACKRLKCRSSYSALLLSQAA